MKLAGREDCRVGQKMSYWTVLALEETFLSICRSSRAIILRFISKTQWKMFPLLYGCMFVSLRRTQTWRLQTKLYKFGWHTYTNNTRMEKSRDLILGKVDYISIIYRISDFWLFLLNGYDFYFDHMTGENRELLQTLWHLRKPQINLVSLCKDSYTVVG